jgi:hypothetical protein
MHSTGEAAREQAASTGISLHGNRKYPEHCEAEVDCMAAAAKSEA